MTVEPLAHILRLADAGEAVDAIAAHPDVGVTIGRVYAILRKHRPDRPRHARRRTSEKRPMIIGLLAQGIKPPRVAELAQVERQYVYRIMSELKIPVDSKRRL